jgi:hypothetical protein
MRNLYSSLFQAMLKKSKTEDEYELELMRLTELYYLEFSSYPYNILLKIIARERKLRLIKIVFNFMKAKLKDNEISNILDKIRTSSKPQLYQRLLTL